MANLRTFTMHEQLQAPGQACSAATAATPRPLLEYNLMQLASFDRKLPPGRLQQRNYRFPQIQAKWPCDLRVAALAAPNCALCRCTGDTTAYLLSRRACIALPPRSWWKLGGGNGGECVAESGAAARAAGMFVVLQRIRYHKPACMEY
jgi:hypothetical protein